jgi:predicted TIM-barrel fold metal-dependent hydrolase
MIIDAHYHLEEEMETVDALLARMKENKVDRVALIPKMQQPVHVSGVVKKAGDLLPHLLMSRARFLGMILYNSTVTSDGRMSTLGVKYDLYHEPDNHYIDVVLQQYLDKFYGWIFVNPKKADPLEEIAKWHGRQGWIGVKTHPFWHQCPVALLDDTSAFCVENKLPLLMHLGGDDACGDFRYLPGRHPELKIIYAHAAVPHYRAVWEYAEIKQNIYIDLSSPIFTNESILSEAVDAMGAERCLFGTDGPYGGATQKRILDQVHRLNLTAGELDLILGGNFMRLIRG